MHQFAFGTLALAGSTTILFIFSPPPPDPQHRKVADMVFFPTEKVFLQRTQALAAMSFPMDAYQGICVAFELGSRIKRIMLSFLQVNAA